MKIVILGAGQVGSTVAHSLSSEENDITVVDVNPEHLKELQQEPEDLIGESDESDAEDLMSLYFGWKRQERKYRLKD